jgi:hypothetical protein
MNRMPAIIHASLGQSLNADYILLIIKVETAHLFCLRVYPTIAVLPRMKVRAVL